MPRGIDVGSEKLHVSIAGDEPVVFGTFTSELYRLRDYLIAQGVTSVAMEATGVYWVSVRGSRSGQIGSCEGEWPRGAQRAGA